MRGRFGEVWGVLSIADPPERSTGHVEIAAGSIDTGQEGRDARHRRHARGLPRRGYRLPRRRPVPFPHVPHRCRCRARATGAARREGELTLRAVRCAGGELRQVA
ncbi:MAG TPA: hypothetical protein VEP73_03015 [Actinomycetota bacterium]|nr:hypothetical protein [Actinomycetota bacterium]